MWRQDTISSLPEHCVRCVDVVACIVAGSSDGGQPESARARPRTSTRVGHGSRRDRTPSPATGTRFGRLFDRLSGQVGQGGIRLALVMRVVPLTQAVVTLCLGLGVYQRYWLGVTALFVAAGWSALLASLAWRRNCPGWMYAGDWLVALAVLGVVAVSVPAPLLTTSFYWAASFAAAVALMLGVGLSTGRACLGLVGLVAGYGVLVWSRASVAAVPVAAGTAMGMVVYCGSGVVIARYLRGFAGTVSAVSAAAAEREAALGMRRARVEEFGRLHDEAVQVLERVAVGDTDPRTLRPYAARSAARLRGHIGGGDDSADAGLQDLAAGFAAFGLDVRVERVEPVPTVSSRTNAVVFGAVTEALHNVAKHAGTDRAWIRVKPCGDGVEITVADHGAGFDVTAVRHGFGLANSIRRRVHDIGGRVEVTSEQGTGTAVTMWLPR